MIHFVDPQDETRALCGTPLPDNLFEDIEWQPVTDCVVCAHVYVEILADHEQDDRKAA